MTAIADPVGPIKVARRIGAARPKLREPPRERAGRVVTPDSTTIATCGKGAVYFAVAASRFRHVIFGS
jgi:hypothetical protein